MTRSPDKDQLFPERCVSISEIASLISRLRTARDADEGTRQAWFAEKRDLIHRIEHDE